MTGLDKNAGIQNYFVHSHMSETKGATTGAAGLREYMPSIWEYPSMKIVPEASLFLARLADSGRSASPHTWKAAATDVEGWFNYLLARDLYWQEAIIDDLISYRDALLTVPSQKTGEPCAASTVRRRMVYIIEFYKYLYSRGRYVGDIVSCSSEVNSHWRTAPSDNDSMTHVRPKRARTSMASGSRKLLPHGRRIRHPRPLSVEDYKALAAAAGPRASETENGSGRDRLILDLAIIGALRVDEVERLRVGQVAALDPEQSKKIIIRGIEGKGRGGKKLRDIEINCEVAKDIIAYIEGERRRAVQQYQRKSGAIRAPAALFYKLPDHSGVGPLSADGIRAAFYKLQLAAKVTEVAENGLVRHRYVFHDLRHTYASWTAAISIEKGFPTNWRAIADQMGHSDPSLTKKTYAHFVEILKNGTRTVIDLGALVKSAGEQS
ncbi:tyrosine-type recombinase/integrase [Kordiimonas sp.]|uniref:tyrosine-type recombinase/integrase n=1 Tax=Kordiimonas sp. TaxID=1970157 RepID=UPI003A902B8C